LVLLAHRVKGQVEIGVVKSADWIKEKWNQIEIKDKWEKSGIEDKVKSAFTNLFKK